MITRRELLAGTAAALCTASTRGQPLLEQFDYGQVQLAPGPPSAQLEQTHQVLMSLSEDSLLCPYRVREEMPAAGSDMGGWYDPEAFAPGHALGQWISALSRYYAATGDAATREKVNRLVRAYAATVEPTGKFYVNNRFPAYIYDKLVCGLIDAHAFVNDPMAVDTLRLTTDAALPHLPPHAMPHRDTPVLHHEDFSEHWWDESYTLPENLFLAWQRTGDPRYRALAQRFLADQDYFDPLARGENVLPGRHAYSHVNSLSSAAMAYLTLGDAKYLRTIQNGFAMVEEQSFATGGWGPGEHFVQPGSGKLGESLKTEHASFETPCGSYGHFKITRYLLRITRESQYGDSMERVMYNTVLGAKPLQLDGRSFYYSDYTFDGHKVYHPDKWPCCSGTLPQIAADYRVSAYFRDGDSLYVNLYVPSSVKWNGRSLRQITDYPRDSAVQLELTGASATYSIFLRVPRWAAGARLTTSGMRDSRQLAHGTFAEIRREWKNGDRIELELPRKRRLQPVDEQHSDTVALLEGPLVLMHIGQVPEPITRASLLRLKAPEVKPFMDIGDEQYSTYVRVTS